ncbi:MAG: DinB family protein, partial [Segetibacter sp.]|nr:DinB family protein [Segetibacter sp.]
FTTLMEPDTEEKKKKKMSAPKNLYPVNTLDSDIVLSEFINQQGKMISLLEDARKINLEKAKLPISIAKLIKLKPGDTFRF